MKQALASIFEHLANDWTSLANRTPAERVQMLTAGTQIMSLSILTLTYFLRSAESSLRDQSLLNTACMIQACSAAYLCILVPLTDEYAKVLSTLHATLIGLLITFLVEALFSELIVSSLCSAAVLLQLLLDFIEDGRVMAAYLAGFFGISTVFFWHICETKDNLVIKQLDLWMGCAKGVFIALYAFVLSSGSLKKVLSLGREIEQQRQQIGELDTHAGYFVHEIRNSLQVLMLPLDSLETVLGEEERAELQKSARLGIDQLKSVFANVSRTKERPKSEDLNLKERPLLPVNVREQIRNVAKLHRAAATGKKLTIRTSIDYRTPTYLIYDTAKINQVLTNLISNSLKFTQRGGVYVVVHWKEFQKTSDSSDGNLLQSVLSISSREHFLKAYEDNDELEEENMEGNKHIEHCSEDAYEKRMLPAELALDASAFMCKTHGTELRKIRSSLGTSTLSPLCSHFRHKSIPPVRKNGLLKIQVIDTGMGISKEQEQRLFREFGQGNAEISAKFGGTGLGLWGSKGIVQELGGDISVDSEPGRGCSIILAFPARIPERASDQILTDSMSNSLSFAEAHKWTVFLVEQCELGQRVLATTVQRLGFSVREYDDIRVALQVASLERPRTRLVLISGSAAFVKYAMEQAQRSAVFSENVLIPILVITDEVEECEAKVKEVDHSGIAVVKAPVDLQTLTNSLSDIVSPRRRKELAKDLGRLVMLVSNKMVDNTIIRQYLRAEGIEIVERRSPEEALTYYRRAGLSVRVLIWDYDLSGTGTYTWLEKVRDLETEHMLTQTSIILMCKEDTKVNAERYAGLGLAHCLRRPLSLRELKTKVSLYLSS